MLKLKENKGITLIALIITIIVMLILVGVTINVALNGGLFENADKAKRLTQLAADEEELQIEIATAYDQKEREVDFSTLATNLRNKGWIVTESGDELICTSPKENTFTVYKNGKITEGGSHSGGGNDNNDNEEHMSELEKYFFSDDGTGKEGLITEVEDLDIFIFTDDGSTIPNASTTIECMHLEGEYIIFEYKGADYKIAITDSNVPTIGENGEKVIKLDNEVYPEGMTEDEIKIKQYFTGYSGSGKQFYTLLDADLSTDGPVFRGNSIISSASQTITIIGSDGNTLKIAYNGETYGLDMDDKMVIYDANKFEKIYPFAYSFSEEPAIIEISETEACSPAFVGILTIIETDDINKIDEFKDVTVNIEDVKYNRVIVNEKFGRVEAVYSEKFDAWFFTFNNDEGGELTEITLNTTFSPMVFLTTTNKEELEQIIQERRESSN